MTNAIGPDAATLTANKVRTLLAARTNIATRLGIATTDIVWDDVEGHTVDGMPWRQWEQAMCSD